MFAEKIDDFYTRLLINDYDGNKIVNEHFIETLITIYNTGTRDDRCEIVEFATHLIKQSEEVKEPYASLYCYAGYKLYYHVFKDRMECCYILKDIGVSVDVVDINENPDKNKNRSEQYLVVNDMHIDIIINYEKEFVIGIIHSEFYIAVDTRNNDYFFILDKGFIDIIKDCFDDPYTYLKMYHDKLRHLILNVPRYVITDNTIKIKDYIEHKFI